MRFAVLYFQEVLSFGRFAPGRIFCPPLFDWLVHLPIGAIRSLPQVRLAKLAPASPQQKIMIAYKFGFVKRKYCRMSTFRGGAGRSEALSLPPSRHEAFGMARDPGQHF